MPPVFVLSKVVCSKQPKLLMLAMGWTGGASLGKRHPKSWLMFDTVIVLFP